jgi:hypothetical protein
MGINTQMPADVTVIVRKPDGSPVAGATVVAINNSAMDPRVRAWRGMTGRDGRHVYQRMDTGVLEPDFYSFVAEKVDFDGVCWRGEVNHRVGVDTEIPITVVEAYWGKLDLSPSLLKEIETLPQGPVFLQGLSELVRAWGQGLTQSTVVLSYWALEGMIHLKARAIGHWKDEWEKKPLGYIINQPELLPWLDESLRAKIRAIATFRTPGAHFKDGVPTSAEAQIAVSVVRKALDMLFIHS